MITNLFQILSESHEYLPGPPQPGPLPHAGPLPNPGLSMIVFWIITGGRPHWPETLNSKHSKRSLKITHIARQNTTSKIKYRIVIVNWMSTKLHSCFCFYIVFWIFSLHWVPVLPSFWVTVHMSKTTCLSNSTVKYVLLPMPTFSCDCDTLFRKTMKLWLLNHG